MKEPIKMKCRYTDCNHEWDYKGISFKAQCYKCKRYTPVPKVEQHDNNTN